MLVTYDNLVLCFTLYLLCQKHDFIEGIFFSHKIADILSISWYTEEKNDFIIINDQNTLFYCISTTHNLLFKYNNHKYKLIRLNSVYAMLQNKHFNNRTTCNKYLYDSWFN